MTRVRSNNALERTVKGLSERAAGARRDFTPAARCNRFARPAQRGRYTDFDGTYA
jgi:hypothetical protein